MFKIDKSDLAYEKCMKLFLEDGEEQQDPNTQMQPQDQGNMEDPNMQQQPEQSDDTSQMSPEDVYKQALEEMDKKIQETGRKRFQKYKMKGGKKSYKAFINDMEKEAVEDIEDEMKEEFGYVPGKESEKDLLVQIKNLLTDMKSSIDMGVQQDQGNMEDPNMQQQPQEQGMVDEQGNPVQQDPNAQIQPQDQGAVDPNMQQQQVDPNQQQPMQEALDYLNESLYRKRMNSYFNYYFN